MSKVLILMTLLFAPSIHYGQGYKKHQSKIKHTAEIISVATSDSLFATSSYDKSVIVWDYTGKSVYKHKLTEGKINSLCFIPNSSSLLIGVTETKGDQILRHVIKCLNIFGKLEYELIDDRITQDYVNISFEQNVTGVRNAISAVGHTFPELDIKKDLEVPQVSRGISHIELVQSIAVSPDKKTIASIDKFNILKTWNQNHKIVKTYKVLNNKKDTKIYFCSDSTIFIEPNIILNIRDTSTQILHGFEKYSSIPLNSVTYFHFNYNNESIPEKLYNLQTNNLKTFDLNNYYTKSGARSSDKIALLGVDGLIRVLNQNGELLSTFGKDRNETMTFRGQSIQLFSKINCIGFSPSGKYIISGDEYGKVTIWKSE